MGMGLATGHGRYPRTGSPRPVPSSNKQLTKHPLSARLPLLLCSVIYKMGAQGTGSLPLGYGETRSEKTFLSMGRAPTGYVRGDKEGLVSAYHFTPGVCQPQPVGQEIRFFWNAAMPIHDVSSVGAFVLQVTETPCPIALGFLANPLSLAGQILFNSLFQRRKLQPGRRRPGPELQILFLGLLSCAASDLTPKAAASAPGISCIVLAPGSLT